ncbi:unnamed protein product [Discosporangium mesarthrocarpum]
MPGLPSEGPLPSTLEDLLAEGQQLYCKVDDADFTDSVDRDFVTSRAETVLTALHERVAKEGVFSVNEEMDDIDTDTLPLLAADFYLGSLLLKLPFQTPSVRLAVLRKAEILLSSYLDKCDRFEILAEVDRRTWRTKGAGQDGEGATGSGLLTTREEKIERLRRRKTTQRRMKEIESELKMLEEGNAEWRRNGNDEEMRRERSLLLLSNLASDSLDELSGVSKEVVMLQHLTVEGGGVNEHFRGGTQEGQKSSDNAHGGLQVTHISSAQGQLQLRREEVRAKVFRPTVELPTMSVEEFGKIELERAHQREVCAQCASRGKSGSACRRRYDQLEADGDEDIEALVEEAVYKDREWDDWKDEHPRGSGNKANKII